MTGSVCSRAALSILAACCLVGQAARVLAKEEATAKIDFNRDVRPILSDKCYRCHGPDEGERKAKLRLDTKDGIFSARKAGPTVAPGKSSESVLFARITAKNPDDRMPPAESGKTLKDSEIEAIRRWIDQGAVWSGHWSFTPPKRPDVPVTDFGRDGVEPARNPIDLFIRARLQALGMKPSPPADPVTLARRVTLDLTGLPTTPAEVDAFLSDTSDEAYENLVDRLLGSHRYGEHMARYWLDTVRYGDTHGLHFDNERGLWPYRDWVLHAFNNNLPFDEFTLEQLAGDLLPSPSTEQLVASGFNRCNVSTSEGGSIDDEVLVRYAVDRVEAMGTVWLGLTVGCAVCHDHKFDPISQRDFYQLFAFFNSFEEGAMDGNALLPPPFIKVATPEQSALIAGLRKEAQSSREHLDGPLPEVDVAQEKWAAELTEKFQRTWRVVETPRIAASGGTTFKKLDDASFLAEGSAPAKDVYEISFEPGSEPVTAIRLEALRHDTLPLGGVGRADNSNFVLNELEASVLYPAAAGGAQRPTQNIAFLSARADYSQKDFEIAKSIDGNPSTGWAVDGSSHKEDRTAVFFPAAPIAVEEGGLLRVRLVQEYGSKHMIGRVRVSVTSDPELAPTVFGNWNVAGPFVAADGEAAKTTEYPPEQSIKQPVGSPGAGDGDVKWTEKPEYADGKVHAFGQEIAATYLRRVIRSPVPRTLDVGLGSDDGIKVWLNGAVQFESYTPRIAAPDQDKVQLKLAAGENHLLIKIVNFGGPAGFYFKASEGASRGAVLDLASVLSLPPERRSDADRKHIREYYRGSYSPEWRELKGKVEQLEKRITDLDAQLPGSMVTKEMAQRRDAYVLRRGQYTQKGEKVSPAVPSAFAQLREDEPPNRLGLAKWLVRPDHPLTARVTVNRYWQQYFGTGIVKTAVDFGSQGEQPVHPELLDWLAVDFIESGWDVKRLQKLIVMSATYRQSSKVNPDAVEKDPDNRWISHGPRYRMDAEMIRDSALSISGLLVERVGGPSVKPPQPSGLWEAVGFVGSNTAIFKADDGDAVYRRGLYTFWKRTSPPPILSLFDAPSRETCTALRPRTNTPLQALAMMNDIQFFEASRRLAERMLREGGASAEERLKFAFRLATARVPRPDELAVLVENLEAQRADFAADPEGATKAIAIGASKPDASLEPKELAAYTMAANLILNLDETLTKG